MPRTPDRFPGDREDEGIVLEDVAADPPDLGGVRYVSGDFRMKDSIGVFNPRSGAFPPATETGEVLSSIDGISFSARMPVTSLTGGWLVNNCGLLLVRG